VPVSWVDMQSDGQTMEGYLIQFSTAGRYPAVDDGIGMNRLKAVYQLILLESPRYRDRT
jgi:hypothetical protein